MNKSLFSSRYRRDITETEIRRFGNGRQEVTFAISNADIDDPGFSEKGRFLLHRNTLLRNIFIFAESFSGFDQGEVVRDLLALKELCTAEEPSGNAGEPEQDAPSAEN